jgi:hypothetical protein
MTLSSISYNFFVQWRDFQAQEWIMDISDVNNNLLIGGIPLLPGADLMAQYQELGFPGQLWVVVDSDPLALPTFDSLGVSSHLYFVTVP